MIRFAFLASVALAVQACPPSPSPPDAAVDASFVSDCAAACAVMSAVCQTQQPPTCTSTLSNAERDRLIRAPSGASLTCACIRAATTKPALAACGAACAP